MQAQMVSQTIQTGSSASFYPRYWLGHPKKMLFSLSVTYFMDQSMQKVSY